LKHYSCCIYLSVLHCKKKENKITPIDKKGRAMVQATEMIVGREIKREPSTLRTKMLRERYLSEKLTICPERAIYFTELMTHTEGEPIILRRAKGFKYVLEKITPIIREGELIVGNQTKFVRGAPLFPEKNVLWIKDALEKTPKEEEKFDLGEGGGIARDFVTYRVAFTPEEEQKFNEVIDYWEGKTFAWGVGENVRDADLIIHIGVNPEREPLKYRKTPSEFFDPEGVVLHLRKKF